MGPRGQAGAPLGPWSLSAGPSPGTCVSTPPHSWPLSAARLCQETWVKAAPSSVGGPCVSLRLTDPRPPATAASPILAVLLGSPLLGKQKQLENRLPTYPPTHTHSRRPMAPVRHLLWRQDPSPRQEPGSQGWEWRARGRGRGLGSHPSTSYSRVRAFSGTRAPRALGIWRHGEVSMLAARVRQGPVGRGGGTAAQSC